MVKAWISWVVSMLLAFQPTAWALSKDDQQNLKKFLEETQITQREVSLKEFYEKTKHSYPENVRKELKALVDADPNLKLPKISVTKVTGSNGEEDVQLQFVHNGGSAIMTLVGKDGIFAKVGKEVIRYEDMQNLDKANTSFEKAISPKGRMATTDRNPSSIPNRGATPVFLKAKDLMKLDKNSQRKYFKNLRDLLETMEEVQHTVVPKKTGSLEKSQIDLFVSLFITQAFAAGNEVGMACIIGGHLSTFQKEANGKLSCGEGDRNLSQGCPVATDVRCNPVVYGSDKPICVTAGYTTTQLCNKAVTGGGFKDIPDIAKTSAELDKLTEAARSQAAQLQAVCEGSFSESSAPSAAFRNKFKDQFATCAEFQNRVAEINRWPCSNPEFKSNKNYARLCEAANNGGQLPPVPPPGTDGGTQPPAPGGQLPPVTTDDNNTCDPKMHILRGESRECHPSQSTDSGSGFCTKDGNRVPAISCSCNGVLEPVGKPCGNTSPADDGGKKKPKKSGWWKRNGKLVLATVGGLVGLGVFYKLRKDAIKKQYDQMLPPEPKTPIPVPEPSPTPPPPRPGVS